MSLPTEHPRCDEAEVIQIEADASGPEATTNSTKTTTYNESCVICLDELVHANDAVDNTATVGSPLELIAKLPCGHLFHNFCIKTWSERTNSCPACRESFNVVEIIQTEGAVKIPGEVGIGISYGIGYEIIQSYTVEDRKAPMPDSLEYEPLLDISLLDPIYYQDHPNRIHAQFLAMIPADELGDCVICDSGALEHELLICDGCNNCLHMSCLGIATVPTGDWFCPTCEIELANGANMADLNLETLDRLVSHNNGGGRNAVRGRGGIRGHTPPMRRGRARTRTTPSLRSTINSTTTTTTTTPASSVTRVGPNGLITRSLGGRINTRSRSRSLSSASSMSSDVLNGPYLDGNSSNLSGSSLIQFLWSNNNNNNNNFYTMARGRTAQDYRYNHVYASGLYETRQAMQRTRREQGIIESSNNNNNNNNFNPNERVIQLIPGRRIEITPEERRAWDMFEQARDFTRAENNNMGSSSSSNGLSLGSSSSRARTPSLSRSRQRESNEDHSSRKLKRPIRPPPPRGEQPLLQQQQPQPQPPRDHEDDYLRRINPETEPFRRPKLVTSLLKNIRGDRDGSSSKNGNGNSSSGSGSSSSGNNNMGTSLTSSNSTSMSASATLSAKCAPLSPPAPSIKLDYNQKVKIQKVVRDNLRPLYESEIITKPQYTNINQTVSRQLYSEFCAKKDDDDDDHSIKPEEPVEDDDNATMKRLSQLAQEYIAKELPRVFE